MPFRRRLKMQSRKRGVKHSGTFLDNIGQGSNATTLTILKTSGGPRSDDGSPQTIQSAASTDEDCRTGDTCQMVNLYVQCAGRQNIGTADENRTGWLEWAFICVRENETQVPATRLGVQTLGDICTNMYRGECIYTGAFPVGTAQPVYGVIQLKIPKLKITIKLGDEWRFITFFRATNSAATETNTVRLIKSFNYKVKS